MPFCLLEKKHTSHWERIVCVLWQLVVGVASIRAHVAAEQWTQSSVPCASWGMYIQTCTSSCQQECERESVNQSASEIWNRADFGIHGVNSNLWACPTRKCCCLSCMIQCVPGFMRIGSPGLNYMVHPRLGKHMEDEWQEKTACSRTEACVELIDT